MNILYKTLLFTSAATLKPIRLECSVPRLSGANKVSLFGADSLIRHQPRCAVGLEADYRQHLCSYKYGHAASVFLLFIFHCRYFHLYSQSYYTFPPVYKYLCSEIGCRNSFVTYLCTFCMYRVAQKMYTHFDMKNITL